MVIANESRVAKSRVVTTFNKARQILVNLAIRYIPSSMYMAPPPLQCQSLTFLVTVSRAELAVIHLACATGIRMWKK
jgi:hypothetical protein